MNTRYTLGLFVAFIAIVALAVYVGRDREPTEMTAGTATPTPPPLLELTPSDVQEVEIDSESGAVTVSRSAGGWEVDGEPASDSVGPAVERLAEPTVVRQLPADREPDDYGFATASLTITLRTQDGDEHVLVFGDDTLVGTDVFVRLNGEGAIFVIGGSDVSLMRGWIDDPPLAPTATPEGGTPTPEGEGTPGADADAGGMGPAAPGDDPGDDDGLAGDEAPGDDPGNDPGDDDGPADGDGSGEGDAAEEGGTATPGTSTPAPTTPATPTPPDDET